MRSAPNDRNLAIMNQMTARARVRYGLNFLYRNNTNLKARNGKFDSAFAFLPRPANSDVATFGGGNGTKVGI